MKYVQVQELRVHGCVGCAHYSEGGSRTKGRETSRKGIPAYESCEGTIWIEDTDEAKRDYLTLRLKGVTT
jgi:hypothetical protein